MLELQLAAAVKQMLDVPYGIEKIEWWLQFAHANERWLQFELGFWLSKQLGDGYAVGCEQNYVDLVIFERKPDVFPLWNNFPIANLELKCPGNWYVIKDVFPNIEADVRKIEKTELPGIAMVIWFFACPNKSAHPYSWITEQIEVKKQGLDSPKAIEDRMKDEFEGKFQKIGSWQSAKATDAFDVHEAHLYCFQNEAARRSPIFANSMPPTTSNPSRVN
jgi:hypothetical protein